MSKLEFQDFGKLYKNMRNLDKKEGILPAFINYKEFESYMSLIISLILTILAFFMVKTNLNDLTIIVSSSQNILLYIIAGLIGMLGFIVAGLAIMLGVTSASIVKKLIVEERIDYYLSVFTSFVYIAYIIGILIVVSTFLYFLLNVNYQFHFLLYLISYFITAYTFFFIVFYIISLLTTCINIFVFNLKSIHEIDEE